MGYISLYLDILFNWMTTLIPYFLCYFVVAAIGVCVAIIELLSRYGGGNRPSWVLWGTPQFLYYLVNALAGLICFFISEALGKTAIIDSYGKSPSSAVVHAALLGVGAMFALRSSLYSIEKPSSRAKTDLGPAQILNVINRYLDRQIDKNRGKSALDQVNKLMKGIRPEEIHPDLSAICLSVPEGIPKEDMAYLKKELDILLKAAPKASPYSTAIVMGMLLQKEVGTATLEAAVDIYRSQSQSNVSGDTSTQGGEPHRTPHLDATSSDMMDLDNTLDSQLSEKLKQLTVKLPVTGAKEQK